MMVRYNKNTRTYLIRQSNIRQKKLHRQCLRRKKIKLRLGIIRKRMSKEAKINSLSQKGGKTPLVQIVPKDFRLLSNPLGCAKFFRELYHMEFSYLSRFGDKEISLDMRNVELVDFPATLMLGAICEELAQRGCNVHGNTPSNVDAYKFIVDSGFFNEMYDENNRKIYKPGNSKIMIVQRGEDRITGDNLLSFVNLLNKTKEHLGVREDADIDDYVAILKEICGNSTEWGNVVRKNWTIGAKFEDGHVDFVALDLGQGILRSLKKRVDKQLTDFIQNKDNCQVLEGVFNRYYGSRSNDSNRNQGLPFIKGCNTKNVISQLHVITNNVLLDFSNQSNDKSFASYNNGLIGTLYSWSVNADCLIQ